MTILDVLKDAPHNLTIEDALTKCYSTVSDHQRIVTSVSGGSDSDVMLDLIIRCGGKDKTTFVFFNTGLEYEATKKQILYLNEKYGIQIQVVPPIKPIPVCVREHGVPFWSKHVSEMIERLQKYDFKWEDKPFEELYEEYPKCKSALRWWCNKWGTPEKVSQFDIGYIRGMKEFLVTHPPTFPISSKCCHYAKKEPAKRFMDSVNSDLNCTGVRRAEGGMRAARFSSCYTQAFAGADQYRPLFWFTDADKATYDEHYGLKHSDCYEVWGMKRTGCAGCPFGRNFEEELRLAEIYEPKFHKAMLKVFGPSYEYRRKFEEFRAKMK